MIPMVSARSRSAVLGLGALALLAGCSGSDAPDYGCPRITVMQDAASLTRFAGGGRDLLDVDYQAQIADFLGGCKYEPGVDGVTVAVAPVIVVDRGPANRDRRAAIEYFVSVVRGSNAILNKQVFATTVAFEGNRARVVLRDSDAPIVITLPGSPANVVRDYDIVIGLQLTEGELDYNMRRRPDSP